MQITDLPFGLTDWDSLPDTLHPGTHGTACWRTRQFGPLRVRRVVYSPGYVADHWCKKGHIVHCLEGEFVSEMVGGEKSVLTKGMTYVVTDELSSHRSVTKDGVKLMIIDGDFLNLAE